MGLPTSSTDETAPAPIPGSPFQTPPPASVPAAEERTQRICPLFHFTGLCVTQPICSKGAHPDEAALTSYPRKNGGPVCRDYSRNGACTRGKRCLYDHPHWCRKTEIAPTVNSSGHAVRPGREAVRIKPANTWRIAGLMHPATDAPCKI